MMPVPDQPNRRVIDQGFTRNIRLLEPARVALNAIFERFIAQYFVHEPPRLVNLLDLNNVQFGLELRRAMDGIVDDLEERIHVVEPRPELPREGRLDQASFRVRA